MIREEIQGSFTWPIHTVTEFYLTANSPLAGLCDIMQEVVRSP